MKIQNVEKGKAGRTVIHLEEGLSFPIGNKECRKLELEEEKNSLRNSWSGFFRNWSFREVVII